MSTSYDEKYEDAYIKDWKQQEEEQITDDEHAPGWDFDPKCRHGSITEETPDEKRRREFYAVNKHAIENMVSSLIHIQTNNPMTQHINMAAAIISEIAQRAGEQNFLKETDPEFSDASCIDEL